jgi:hypothetical protein
MMLCSSEVFWGCYVLLNATGGTIALSFSEVLSRKSTPGVETLDVLRETCGNGREWTSFLWFYGALRAAMRHLYHLIRWLIEFYRPPHTDSLARFCLFILSLFSFVIITFWFSAFSVRTCFRYFSVLIMISRPTTKKVLSLTVSNLMHFERTVSLLSMFTYITQSLFPLIYCLLHHSFRFCSFCGFSVIVSRSTGTVLVSLHSIITS